eukprot:scaffold3343_cov120-Isochrysis_galbana.AAC.1
MTPHTRSQTRQAEKCARFTGYAVDLIPANPNAFANVTRHTEWVPEAGPTQEKHRRKRPVGSQWEP